MSGLFTTIVTLLIICFIFVELYTFYNFETYGSYIITITTLRAYLRAGKINRMLFMTTLSENVLEHPIYKVFLVLDWLTIAFYFLLLPIGLIASSIALFIQSKIVAKIVVNKNGMTILITLLLKKVVTVIVLVTSVHCLWG